MPLIKSKTAEKPESNADTSERAQNLAVAYNTQRQAKKKGIPTSDATDSVDSEESPPSSIAEAILRKRQPKPTHSEPESIEEDDEALDLDFELDEIQEPIEEEVDADDLISKIMKRRKSK